MKYKFISFINLFGLTTGLTCCLLITTYILTELSYDRYNKNADQIYRVTRSFNTEDGVVSLNLSTVSPPFGYYLPTDFPEIQKMTRLLNFGTVPLRYKDKLIDEQNVYFADEHLSDVFTVDVVKGNPKTALKDPFSVMLTEETAKKYFGNEDPINKVIRANNQFDVKVTGVYKAFPSNAHMHPGMMISFNTLRDSAVYGEENLRTNWGNNSFFTYIVLPKGYNIANMKSRFPAFLDKHMGDEYGGKQPSKFTKLDLQKLTDIHLYSHTDYEAEPNGDIKRVYIFSAIALFILLIACINYMNLSTARSALRAREIGIRKVIGARRKEIIFQFLSESVLLCCIAILFAAVLTYIMLPWLNKVSGQEFSFSTLLKWQIIVPLFLTPFLVGALSGIYPAMFMSSFQPVKTLKGLFNAQGSSISFRKVLVITQFSISIILIITTMIVFQQLRYMQRASLGYDKEHILTLPYYSSLNDRYESFRNTLLQNSNIKEVGRSSRIPTGRLLDGMGAFAPGSDSMTPVKADIRYVAADYDFIPTYGIHIDAGRNFSRDYGTDTANFIINEAAVKAIGWKSPQEAVGKNFRYGFINDGHIIGVMKDFHFESLHQQIAPLILIMPAAAPGQSFYNNLSIKISGNNIPAALATIKDAWQKFLPELPYQYTFLDENFSKLYESEQRQGTIFIIFACIAIFIACLGLFGLSAFAITQRVKEIGVRKVLGANVSTIVALLSKDFLKLVIIAAFIAFPVAWYAMHNWLEDFAYRINIQWWVFVLAGMLAAFIALITVSFQAIKAAIANPVAALRSE
ncbi:MAG TPA: FtsX-like permease family protein [Chitinophagaceae bacterium]|jgi:putative ABC transport system permease protein